MSEKEIVESILKGNTTQFSLLVDAYSKMCFSVAYRIVNDIDEAQDIVQESFISAFEHLKGFKGDAKFSTWLYRIVMNKAIAFKNKQKYFVEIENQSIVDEDYDEELEAKTSLDAKKALSVLNEKERLIIELFYYQEQSVKEISHICQTTEVNIKVQLHRARKKMNDVLNKNGKFASNE